MPRVTYQSDSHYRLDQQETKEAHHYSLDQTPTMAPNCLYSKVEQAQQHKKGVGIYSINNWCTKNHGIFTHHKSYTY